MRIRVFRTKGVKPSMLLQAPPPSLVHSTSRFHALSTSFFVSWLHGASRALHLFILPGGSRSNRLLPELPAPSLSLQLKLPSKCLSAAESSAADGWYHHRHQVSFMSLYGAQYIINNNILPDVYCMTATLMNCSGESNNHEQTEKQTKKQSVCCT